MAYNVRTYYQVFHLLGKQDGHAYVYQLHRAIHDEFPNWDAAKEWIDGNGERYIEYTIIEINRPE